MIKNKEKWKVVFFISLFLGFCIAPGHTQEVQENKEAALKTLAFSKSSQMISMDFKDASLKDVFKVFSIQSGVNFIASQEIEDRTLTLYFDKVSVKEAIDKLFKANKLDYEFDESANIVIVKNAEPEIETITKVYYLKYRSVPSATIEKEKTNLLSNAGGAKASEDVDIINSIKQVLSNEGKKDKEGSGKIAEDIRTNSLIITDVPGRFPFIEEIINRLDIPQPQVMLEVEMLDVSKSTVDKLGFNFTDNPLTLILPGEFAHKGVRFFMGDLAKKGAQITDSGVAGSVVLGNSYAALLDFLRTQSDTRYLARPRILTLNNETAEISITKDEVVSKKRVWVTDTGGEGHWEEEYERATNLTLTPEGIGVYLRVTPRINPETKEITMVINPKTSSATQSPYVTDELARDPEIRSTKSVVKVFDGETIVLGGLIHRDKFETLKKIPFLGDIPIIGALFRHKDKERDLERELIVFITPRIIEDASTMSAQVNNAILSLREQGVPSKETRILRIENTLESLEIEDNLLKKER
ncbi:MAG: secretin N-terminal domain-containing protein [Candidatus Omnitrophota bacterium]